VQQERAALQAERDTLERERQVAQGREAFLRDLFENLQRQYERLLDRPVQPVAAPFHSPSAPSTEALDRGAIRRRILQVLADHPGGLHHEDVRQRLGLGKSLADTMRAMAGEGRLQRTRPGCYRVAGEEKR
jgi:hypothetical protein